ncbi:MAG: uridine kinase [Gammaproteobacteria bacterium HGW-Gammaproteobacteria-11]|nr:MAG: uridine kinase [Gammaproteobacteria bacterium HGW-Gammaproteobacteria-11]
MNEMTRLMARIAKVISDKPSAFVTRVAVDGVDGAGKTVFADALGRALSASGRTVIRVSVDGFHNPRSVRYRRGRFSAEGFYLDSYDYCGLKTAVLEPLSPGGSGQWTQALFDHRSDSPITSAPQQAVAGAILLFDGIFAQRPELRGYWDITVFLDVRFDRSIARMRQRDGGPADRFTHLNWRYCQGQKHYIRACAPFSRATMVVDNNDVLSPFILHRAEPRRRLIRLFNRTSVR